MSLGTDLAVVPLFVAHDAAEIDLTRTERPLTTHLRALLTELGGTEPPFDTSADLATLSGRENLAQALILRLLTPRGSLAELGHAAYGSRLHELIGQNKTSALRNLCRAHVLEAVIQEPRVEDTATTLEFDVAAETASSFVLTLGVRPREGGDPVDLALEVGL
jgi:phage baseplate assembly protein W